MAVTGCKPPACPVLGSPVSSGQSPAAALRYRRESAAGPLPNLGGTAEAPFRPNGREGFFAPRAR